MSKWLSMIRHLQDHYDPLQKRLVLSRANFYGTSTAAVGDAAHECGHAIQEQTGYAPLQWKMASVGFTTFASQIALWLPLLGMFSNNTKRRNKELKSKAEAEKRIKQNVYPSERKTSLTAWKISGTSLTMDQFIDQGGRSIDVTDLKVLKALTGRLFEKLKSIVAESYPAIRKAIHLIAKVLESPHAQIVNGPLPKWIRELAFGARYFLKGFDLIPGHLPEIGLAVDALLLDRIIERNRPELDRHFAMG
jgi:hypothetical protein